MAVERKGLVRRILDIPWFLALYFEDLEAVKCEQMEWPCFRCDLLCENPRLITHFEACSLKCPITWKQVARYMHRVRLWKIISVMYLLSVALTVVILSLDWLL